VEKVRVIMAVIIMKFESFVDFTFGVWFNGIVGDEHFDVYFGKGSG
jgi:hypothetical protein